MSFFSRIIAFFMSVIAFFSGLFSGGKKPAEPTPDPAETKTYTFYDCAYGSDARQTLDLVLPENASGETGLILFIHGGAWISGSKDQYRDTLKTAARMGYAAAALNYRYLSDSVSMAHLMADVASALTKISTLAAGQDVSLSKVLLTGTSAGAQMSLLYAYRYADAAPIRPAAVVSFCGPTDLTSEAFLEHNELGDLSAMLGLMNRLAGVSVTEAEYRDHTGNYAAWLEALRSFSPLYQVGPGCVPTVLGHGRQDTIVPFDTAAALDAALAGQGVTHEFVIFPNSGHSLDRDEAASARMYDLLVGYAEAYLK